MTKSVRKKLPHDIPGWVESGSRFFITICTKPRGVNQLCLDGIAEPLWESICFYKEQQIWWPHLVVLMPDHLHGIISFASDPGMRKAVSNWKRYTALKLNIKWQRDFFDHRLRRTESLDAKAMYLRNNPVRAGFAQNAEDWPYQWSMPSIW